MGKRAFGLRSNLGLRQHRRRFFAADAGCGRTRRSLVGRESKAAAPLRALSNARQPRSRTSKTGFVTSPHQCPTLLLWFPHDDSAPPFTSNQDLVSRLFASPVGLPGLCPGPVPAQFLPKRLHFGSLDRARLAVCDRVPDRDLRGLRDPVRPVPVGTRARKRADRTGTSRQGPPWKEPDVRHPVRNNYLALVCAITMASAMRADQLSMMPRARSPSHQEPSCAGASSVFMTAAA